MKIYCDESGYTGSDLLGDIQPYFVYSGAKLDDFLTQEIVNYISNNYNIQNGEIKGKNIVKSTKGKKVIKYLFENYSQHVRIVYSDKKYVLSAKIVEYGIEPYLKSNELFYTTNLNKFIASCLYSSFVAKDVSAEYLFKDFLLILKGEKSFKGSVLNELNLDNYILDWVVQIATHKPEIVIAEIEEEGKVEKWILDITMTSLLGILSEWSKNGDPLEVVCDKSNVFIDNKVFENMKSIGLNNSRAEFMGISLGFNLKNDIVTGDSKDIRGLQIADLFSSTIFYCLNNKNTEFSRDIMKIVVKNCLCTPATFCVIPDIIYNEYDYEKNKMKYYPLMNIIFNDIKN